MNTGGVSDLSAAMRMQRLGQSTRSALSTAGFEVASGKKSDLVKATNGDLSTLFAIERNMARLDTRAAAISMASARAQTAQIYLEKIQGNVAAFGTNLIAAVDLENQTQAFSIASSARGAFDSIVSAMNGRYGDHALFSGAAVDSAATINAQAMYDDIVALTSAAPDSVTAIAAIDDYFFNPAGGFMTTGFMGDAADAAGAEVGAGEVVNYSVRGDADALRNALRNAALVAIASNGDHGGTALDGMVMLREAANGAIATVDDMIDLREGLGHIEERLSNAAAFNVSEKNTFEINRNGIIAADPYEAATRFQALEGQMEALYLMTSRLSTMRLQNYLR